MTAPNAELAYRVLDHIDAHPEQWNQRWWFTQLECGTAACFAGWACILSGDQPRVTDADDEGEFSTVIRPDGLLDNVEDRAEALLGLDDRRSSMLFFALNSREDLGQYVANIFGPRPAATTAVHRKPDDVPDLDAQLAEEARDRKLILAPKPGKPWLVVRQYSIRPDELHSTHRWEWIAERRAKRLTRRADEFGVFYNVQRRAES